MSRARAIAIIIAVATAAGLAIGPGLLARTHGTFPPLIVVLATNVTLVGLGMSVIWIGGTLARRLS
jgi:hypothetical protein